MKKTISIILSTLMVFSTLGSTTAFAVGEKVAPVKSGRYHDYSKLNNYLFVNADEPSQFTTIDATFSYQSGFAMFGGSALNDKYLERKIKEEYASTFKSGDVTADELSIRYYGTLSDGTMILNIDGPFGYLQALEFSVVGNYVYSRTDSDQFEVYKDGEFSTIDKEYENGHLTGDLLDETAKLLCFAKFADRGSMLCGDVDLDGEINIKDATTIQKHIAELDVLNIPSTVLDANNDGAVNIMDSTEIQKYLVECQVVYGV